MNIATSFSKAYSKLANKLVLALENRVWKERVATVKATLNPGSDDDWIRTLIDNTERYQRQQASYDGRTSFSKRDSLRKRADQDFKLAVATIKRLAELKNVVGVQPLSSPVGLIFRITYTELPPNPDEQADAPKRASLQVLSVPAEAKSRKLRARLTVEASQDAFAVHEIGLGAEIVSTLSHQVVTEIVHETIDNLKTLAGAPKRVKLGAKVHPKDQADKLVVQINALSNEIAMATRRGPANFVIVSPTTFERLAPSAFVTRVNEAGDNVLKLAGYLSGGLIKVYKLEGFADDTVLVGYKGGSGETDAGYIYSPYLPLMLNGPVIDPTTYQPSMTAMTRYGANTFSNSEAYYRTLELA
jgi:hypothetical protein